MGLLTEIMDANAALVRRWREEADEREARAAHPDVVGLVERECEEAAVRALRRCADELERIAGSTE